MKKMLYKSFKIHSICAGAHHQSATITYEGDLTRAVKN